jgi:hypothetical protein
VPTFVYPKDPVQIRFRNTNFEEYAMFPGDNHVLNMRLVDHLFDDMLIEEAEVPYLLFLIPDPWPK